MKNNNYIKFSDFNIKEYLHIFNRTNIFLKKKNSKCFKKKTMIMIFDKPSTRTRISFEVGFKEEQGSVIFLNSNDTQISRGESIKDSARTISSFCDIIVIRTFSQNFLEVFSKYSKVPVINALTDKYHPCQVFADIYTLVKKLKVNNILKLKNKTITWIGDYNNIIRTWIEAANIFKFKLNIVLPKCLIDKYKKKLSFFDFSHKIERKFIKNSDLLITDTWFSMGDDNKNIEDFKGLTVTSKILSFLNKKPSYFTHCLPAHEGQEIEKGLLNNKKSIVWDVVLNKLHTQKAIINFLLFKK